MAEIKFDPNNYRVHNDKNKRVIRKSLEDCGAGRSVLVDKDNYLIAGNGVYEQAQQLGIPVRVIETDGEELVVVKRTDLSSEDEKRKLLALADNYSSDLSEFDYELVLQDFSAEDLDLWEFSIDDIVGLDASNELDNLYTKKVTTPVYEPTGEKPKVEDLFDIKKSDELLAAIQKADISDIDKSFLTIAAYRHIIFDYSKIAEYYAHASKEVQKLMEDSALVIIDFNKAIELGYVKLKQDIADQYLEDYDDEA